MQKRKNCCWVMGTSTRLWHGAHRRSNKTPLVFSDTRHRLLGDSFSMYSFIIIAAALVKQWIPRVAYQHLVRRMGLAPGFRCNLRRVAPLQRCLRYGSASELPSYFQKGIQLLNTYLLRKTNHTGTDIRVVTGEAMNSRTFPRQSVAAFWWNWQHGFRKRWTHKSHINMLELETILLGLKFQISRLKAVDQRIFQLTDSYVGMSIVSKGRTSSKQLTRTLNQISAHLLAFGLHMIMGHVESTENPSDEGSRT